MDSSLHRGISKYESTHRQGDHHCLSVLLKKFMIHTDSSDVQLRKVIMQEGKPLDVYSQKLSESATMLHNDREGAPNHDGNSQRVLKHTLGHKIKVLTNHENLTYETIETEYWHMQIWKILIQ